ncbi:MAG: WecB/TagA/CpsF family glycosyltransferase [Thermomicrobiales bacterium]
MRVTLLDLPVDILSHGETVRAALEAMETGRSCQHVALNVAKLVNARVDPELERDIRASDIIGIDGVGIVLALRMSGHRVPHRVAGIDLFESLMEECARRGLRPFLLGGRPAIVERAVRTLMQRHPGLQPAGWHHGYFTEQQEDGVCDLIASSGAHALFVAMPTPRKERFMHRARGRLGVPFLMGIGGTLDVVAGHVHRAPRFVRSIGLEWFYRMMQEPRRLAWRYLRTNVVFAGLVLRMAGSQLGASVSGTMPWINRTK